MVCYGNYNFEGVLTKINFSMKLGGGGVGGVLVRGGVGDWVSGGKEEGVVVGDGVFGGW